MVRVLIISGYDHLIRDLFHVPFPPPGRDTVVVLTAPTTPAMPPQLHLDEAYLEDVVQHEMPRRNLPRNHVCRPPKAQLSLLDTDASAQIPSRKPGIPRRGHVR